MSCFHPLKGFKIGYNPSGKPSYKVTGYDVQFVKKSVNDVWLNCYEWTKQDRYNTENIVSEYIDIPCGHCIGCYLDRSRQWADRCMLEAQYHSENSFITLTYDDEHLPKKGIICNEDGEAFESPLSPLVKSDLQKFMKRLRKRFPEKKIRFFACGEYGSKSLRCHYHIILFGVDFHEDREFFKNNFGGSAMFTSPTLSSLWPFGYSVICDVTWNTCAYVSRYCLKKRNNDLSDLYDYFDLTPEFTLMSRRPGIARDYYEDNKEKIYQTEEIYLSSEEGSRKLRPPKYFDKLYDIDYPTDFENIREHRQEFAKVRKDMILSETDLDYLDYLAVKERNLTSKTKIFNERSNYEAFI